MGKIEKGSLVFGSGGSEEGWSQTWPLSIGAYKVVMARNGQAPYQVIADSTRFTVEEVPEPTTAPIQVPVTSAPVTRAPVTPAPVTMTPTVVRPLPPSDFIKTDKLSYFSGEDIEISFLTKNAQIRDWLGIATDDVSGEISDGEMWLWACGERDPCSDLVSLSEKKKRIVSGINFLTYINFCCPCKLRPRKEHICLEKVIHRWHGTSGGPSGLGATKHFWLASRARHGRYFWKARTSQSLISRRKSKLLLMTSGS